MSIILSSILHFLIYAIIFMVITGGFILKFDKGRFEMSSVDAWALAFSLFYFLAYKYAPHIYQIITNKLNKIIDVLTNHKNHKKIFLSFFIGFFVIILTSHLFKHWSFNTNGGDVAFVNHGLHHAFGDPMFKCDPCRGETRFSEHTGFSLFLIAPLTNAVKSEEFIIFLQIGLTFLALYLLLSAGPLKGLQKLWPYALIIFLAHKSFKYTLVWNFKEDHLGMVLYFLALIALYRQKLVWFILGIIGVLLSKEYTPFFIFLLSVPIMMEKDLPLTRKQRKFLSILTIIMSVIWIALLFKFIIPYFLPPTIKKSHLVSRLPGLGETPKEVLINLFLSPTIWWKLLVDHILNFNAIKYVVMVYGPFVYFIRKRWWWFVPTLPIIAMNLISRFDGHRMLIFHYEVFIIPILLFATSLELKKNAHKSKKYFLVGLLIALCLSGRWPGQQLNKFWPTTLQFKEISFFNDLNNDIGVLASSSRVLAQLTHLREIRFLYRVEDKLHELDIPNYYRLHIDRINEYNHAIIDADKEHELTLMREMLQDGWSHVRKSISGRFIILKNEN